MKCKKYLVLIGLVLSQTTFGQVQSHQRELNEINEKLMIGLGSYAVSNFIYGGVGYLSTNDEYSRHFHQMNMMWNTVNLGLAVPGYLKASKDSRALSAEELNRLQKKTEMIFLVNDVLDLGYVAAGFWLRRNAASQADQEAMYRGYGDSMIMQGSVLLAFDALAYIIHHNHGKQLDKMALQAKGNLVGVVISLD